jgi:hypothetical protein
MKTSTTVMWIAGIGLGGLALYFILRPSTEEVDVVDAVTGEVTTVTVRTGLKPPVAIGSGTDEQAAAVTATECYNDPVCRAAVTADYLRVR